MADLQSVSRRTAMKAAAVSLAAGYILNAPMTQGKQSVASVRDPLVAGMAPSTVGASESFKAARGAEVVLNTQVQSESEVQNRFDLAVLEMFNVMKANEHLLASGEMAPFIAAGNVPVGIDTATFSAELTNAPDEYPITGMFYPESAADRNGGQWGVFDAKKGLRVQFVEEVGLFDVTVGVESQIYGLTPRLTENRTLQLDIYIVPADPRSNPSIQFPDIAEDVAHSWIASNMMQIMMMSYGSNMVFNPVYDPFNTGVRALMDMLFLPPNTINDTIASLMLNKPKGAGTYLDYSDTSNTCLLDYRPL